MRKLIDKIVSLIKKENFELDKRIPISYLFSFFTDRFISLLHGFILFRSTKRVFVHVSTKIKCKRMIRFGNNLSIARYCYIDALSSEGILIGNNVSIGKNTCIECTGNLQTLGKGFIVGDNVGLGTHGFFGCAGGVKIGSDTIIGNYVSFHSENHNYSDINIPIRLQGVSHKGITIGKNCWIGAKATFLDGANVGNGCIVAAGAVIKGDFPENSIIGGIPAKVLKSRL